MTPRKTAIRKKPEPVPREYQAPLPVHHPHAAGIDVATHWVCVGSAPGDADPIREFPAHTPGLRELVDWLRQCGVTNFCNGECGVRSAE